MARAHGRALLLSAALFFFGCSELPIAPREPLGPSNNLIGAVESVETEAVEGLGQVVAGVRSPVLKRERPLQRDEIVSETIGQDGGVIHLPRAGLTVTVPRGALHAPTTITVTARAGALLGYEFAPHGLRFKKPVTLTQNVTIPEGGLQVVYFHGDLKDVVDVLEVLPVLSSSTGQAVTRIGHFSGYAYRGYVVATD
jgi:hypothetical protein